MSYGTTERTILRRTNDPPKVHKIKAVVPPPQAVVTKAASGELCLYICLARALLSPAPALVSKYDPRGLQQARLRCIHQTAARGTLKRTANWSSAGCKRGLLCQKILPKGTSTWPGDLVFKGRCTFKPRRAISGGPKNPHDTQMKDMKASHSRLPTSPLHLCPSYYSFVLFCFDMCPGNLCALKKLGYPGK